MSSRVEITLDLTDEMVAKIGAGMNSVVAQTGAFIENTAKVKINSGPKTGRVYTQPQNQPKKLRPYPHQASAPGESPANWTGQLANSVEFVMTGDASAEVRVGAGYGEALEIGTASGKIKPRPFLVPSVELAAPFMQKLLDDLVND